MANELGMREKKKRRTRQALTDAALRLYGEGGLEAVTVAAIAREADVSVGTFFTYFPTKEDVFLGDTEERIGGMIGRLRSRDRSEPLLTSVRVIVGELGAEVLRSEPGDLEERLRALQQHPSIAKRLRERWDFWEDDLAKAIAEEEGLPDAPEPYLVAAAIIGAFRAFVMAAARHPAEEWPELADRTFRLLSTGLDAFGAHPSRDRPEI